MLFTSFSFLSMLISLIFIADIRATPIAETYERRKSVAALPFEHRQSPEFDEVHPLIKHQRKTVRKRVSSAEKDNGYSIRRRGSTAIPLISVLNDSSYVATVLIGSPPQSFTLSVTTASPETFVPAPNCTIEGAQRSCSQTPFGSDLSSTFKVTGDIFNSQMATGHASGIIATDIINVGGFTLHDYAFAVVDTEGSQFEGEQASNGQMGLKQTTIPQRPSVLETLQTAGLISATMMGIKTPRSADGLNDGEITFGDVNHAKFDDSTSFPLHNVFSPGDFWGVEVDGILVNGKGVNDLDTGIQAIIDLGTSRILMPRNDALAIHSKIPGTHLNSDSTTFSIPCDIKDVNLSISFSGQKFEIDSRDMVLQQSQDTCTSGIAIADQWILGAAFMKNVYMIFQEEENAITFAKLT